MNDYNEIKRKANKMKTKHTSGGWMVDTTVSWNGRFEQYKYIIHTKKKAVANIDSQLCYYDPKEAEANAHLIETAPELLEALRVARLTINELLDDLPTQVGFDVRLRQIDQAIAKATGGEDE